MQAKSLLRFKDYVVDEVSFIKGDDKINEIDIDFDIESIINFEDSNNFSVQLKTEVFKNIENVPFQLIVNLTGYFEIDDIEMEKKNKYAEQNGVAILFPYVRALITNYTALCNITPLILPPINVVKYIENKNSRI